MDNSLKGTLIAVFTYIWWGILPLYWHLLLDLTSYEIICHRIIWTEVTLLAIIALSGRISAITSIFKDKRQVGMLMISGLLIGGNWAINILGANSGHLLDLGLGQYITPLLSIFFGCIFFREKMNIRQSIAVTLAFSAVALQIYFTGSLPLLSIGITLTFAFYGVVKKGVTAVDPQAGVFVETLVVMPIALWGLYYLKKTGVSNYPYGAMTNIFLFGCGLVTFIPLYTFAKSLKYINLTTLGFIQYIGPTFFFLIGTFVWHEPMNIQKLLSFCLIWLAAAIYLYDAVKRDRQARQNKP